MTRLFGVFMLSSDNSNCGCFRFRADCFGAGCSSSLEVSDNEEGEGGLCFFALFVLSLCRLLIEDCVTA